MLAHIREVVDSPAVVVGEGAVTLTAIQRQGDRVFVHRRLGAADLHLVEVGVLLGVLGCAGVPAEHDADFALVVGERVVRARVHQCLHAWSVVLCIRVAVGALQSLCSRASVFASAVAAAAAEPRVRCGRLPVSSRAVARAAAVAGVVAVARAAISVIVFILLVVATLVIFHIMLTVVHLVGCRAVIAGSCRAVAALLVRAIATVATAAAVAAIVAAMAITVAVAAATVAAVLLTSALAFSTVTAIFVLITTVLALSDYVVIAAILRL